MAVRQRRISLRKSSSGFKELKIDEAQITREQRLDIVIKRLTQQGLANSTE
jgi:hypothetical protein